MNTAARFLSAFTGSEVAHGQTTVGKTGRAGKAEAKSFVVREPLTEEKVQAHLDGGQGIGAIPINSENKCRFGAIDVDDYDLNLTEICARVAKSGLPLTVCRSKSGGAHLYLFLYDWEQASLVREYLTEVASLLGFAGREIFPKQDTVLHDKGDVGNFINLPYHRAEQTMRYALDSLGEAMSLDAFLDVVEERRCNLSDIETVLDKARPAEKELKDYPPCVQTLVALNHEIEGRNKFLMHATVAIKKERPDDWEEALDEFNRRYINPPLSSSELASTIVKSHRRKDYGFMCNEPPMVNYCDKAKCRQCKFGIGGGGGPSFFPSMDGMSILLSDPRMYTVNVDGQRLQLTIEELNSPREFQKKCLYELNKRPDILKDREWGRLVNGLLAEAEEVPAPPELTIRGQFIEHLQEFCTSQIRAMAPEELTMGKPWTNNGVTSFKLQGLADFLKKKDFKDLSRPQIQQILRDMNDRPEDAQTVMKVRTDDGKDKSVRVWRVPAFDSNDVELTIDGEEAEIPF